jgi:hypothetical protein
MGTIIAVIEGVWIGHYGICYVVFGLCIWFKILFLSLFFEEKCCVRVGMRIIIRGYFVFFANKIQKGFRRFRLTKRRRRKRKTFFEKSNFD